MELLEKYSKLRRETWAVLVFVFSLAIEANTELDRQFLTSVKEGDLKKVELLLSQGATVDAKDDEGRTAIMLAQGEDVVEFLIKHGANINAQDVDGNSVLFYRLLPILKVKIPDMDDLAEAKRLIESGALVEYTARKGEDQKPVSLLNMAIRNQSLALVKFLIENGANANHDPGGVEEYPLFLAVGGASSPASLAITEYLLANGSKAVFTSRLKDAYTPAGSHQIGARNAFHYATESKQIDPKILDVLAKAGTNLNHRDAEGKTPLMEAIERKNIQASQKLIQLGADLSLSDNQGKTALDLAKEFHLDEIERILTEKLSSKLQ
ncbi:ankyrin repeat domain-containing protein [Leptospira sarikeiensis]|uniref:Ankyrin repeat domain-containing protein n=1 Tax=Leptospira sarikeiensis TaxID=2484943 RepID=A0A4V3JRR4_9LEPT|nr:ankyrin repeat domain-containing protein [Leptospira sarikeiensis]TGL61431.1 ankyrin repeat domain-containing protein [Leptospira sarikeiensis]